MLRLQTAFTRSGKPSFSLIEWAFSARICSVPEPTFPRPMMPIPTSIPGRPLCLYLRRFHTGSCVPYHSNGMRLFRSMPAAVAALCLLLALHPEAWPQVPQDPTLQLPDIHDDEDHKLPNGKSQKDAVAKSEHDK